jgi:hypothetical protein
LKLIFERPKSKLMGVLPLSRPKRAGGNGQSSKTTSNNHAEIQRLSKQAQVEWDRQVADSFPGEAEGLLHDHGLNLTEDSRFFCVLDEDR